MKIPLLLLLLTGLAWAQPEAFEKALPDLRSLLYRDPAAFAKAFQPWIERLPDLPPGAIRAEFFALRAGYCERRRDPAGEIANLKAALAEPGLQPGWKFAHRLDLATAYLYQKNLPAYQETVLEAIREGPARLREGELQRLLRMKNEEATQRGDLAFNLVFEQMTAQHDKSNYSKLRLADWYYQQGRPDGQLEWWLLARDALQQDPQRSGDHLEWRTLWRTAPPSEKNWALQQVLQALSPLTPGEQARARVSLALSMQGQSQTPAEIEAVLQPALDQLQQAPHKDFRIYQDLASLLSRTQPEKAADFLRQALQLASRDPAQRLGHLYFSLASDLQDAHRPEEGLATFREGLLYVLEHEPDEIQRFFYRAIAAATQLNRQDSLAELRTMLLERLPGLPSSGQGMALEALLQSYSHDQVEQRAQVLTRLRAFYQKHLQECLQGQNWQEYAQTGRGLAQTLAQLGDERGARHIQEEILQQTIPQELRAIVEDELVFRLAVLNDGPAAQKLAEKLRASPDPDRQLRGLGALVRLQRGRGQWQQVLQLIGECPPARLTSTLLYERYLALTKLGRWQEAWNALDAWESAFPPRSQARSHFDRAVLAQALGRSEQARTLYQQGFAALLKQPDALEAANYLAGRRGDWRQPLEQLLQVMPLDQANRLIVEHALTLAHRGQKAEGRKLLQQKKVISPRLAAEYPEFSPAQEPLGAVLDRLHLARPDLESALPLRSTNLARLQAHLQKDQSLIAYLPADEQILRVVLTEKSQKYQSISLSEKQIEQDFQSLARHKTVDLDEWKRRLIPKGQPRHLLIAPTGALWKLPFTALVEPDQSVSLLSSTDFSRLSEGQASAFHKGPALAIGAPPAADLPGAEAELKKLAQIWKPCRLKIGPQATPAALLQQPQPLALLHIATHTLARPEDPLQSHLQLHGGNLLLTQLHQLKLRKDSLVVLSSCRGALPLNPGQPQPISLATALSAAGAQTVIANLWDADDQAATLFFDHFYRRLAHHQQVGRAFQEARQALRKAYPDPFYWAGFCLLGNPPT